MRNKKATVTIRSETASFFFPSRYHRMGRPKTKEPVTEADRTNKDSMAIGMSRFLSELCPNSFGALNSSDATNVIYSTVPNALMAAYLKMGFFIASILSWIMVTLCLRIVKITSNNSRPPCSFLENQIVFGHNSTNRGLLQSEKDKGFYIGFTSDPERRLIEHQHGLVDSTKNRRPIQRVYLEGFRNEDDARERERQLKQFGSAYKGLLLRIQRSIGDHRGVV